MAIYSYSPEVHEFVKANCTKLRDDELAEACNEKLGTRFTKSSMKSFRANHHYLNGFSRGLTTEEFWRTQKRWPKGMYEFIRDNSWGVSSKEMAERVNEKFGTNFTQYQMKSFRQRNRIKSGLTGWYQKGHPPGNKGKKLEEYVGQERAAEIRKRMAPTQFKKGERPLNEMPLGSIVVNSAGYKLRKRSMEGTLWERWEFLHRALWEEAHGPIPDGMVVIFKDGNKSNCELSNLMLISKRENSCLNKWGLRSEDPGLTEAGVNLVKLKNAATDKRKRRKRNENRG